ncbi:hypothetical protein, partial [Comamonas sp. UBA7528]|uniref:hypothetical protein n=1 Tax=Comamonas sp. UBA7528 TaxID=1946391 RepID=UPI0025BDB190
MQLHNTTSHDCPAQSISEHSKTRACSAHTALLPNNLLFETQANQFASATLFEGNSTPQKQNPQP